MSNTTVAASASTCGPESRTSSWMWSSPSHVVSITRPFAGEKRIPFRRRWRMAWRTLGAPPQYWSLRARTTLTPGSHVSSLKGPVPTGFLTMSLPCFLSASGL